MLWSKLNLKRMDCVLYLKQMNHVWIYGKLQILKRAKYLRDEITSVRIIYGNKFDSVKLQVADKDDITTIYSIQFFNTGSVTVQGNYVSQWCEFEFEDLCELVNKLENSDKDSYESLIKSALCETHWNNTWFLNSIDFCDDSIDSLVLQIRKSEEQNIGVGLHTIVDENKDTPVITDIHDLTKTPEPILIDTPVLPTTSVISPEKRLQYLRRAGDTVKLKDDKINKLQKTIEVLQISLKETQKQNKELNTIIQSQNESQKVNKVESQFESFNKTLQTVNKYIRDHEDLKKEFMDVKEDNKSFKHSQLIDPCNFANLNQDILLLKESTEKLEKKIEHSLQQQKSENSKSFSNTEEFFENKIIQTVKEERDINLTSLNSSKHEMNEKISQLKFSVEQSKVENSLAIKEISEKLASIQSELTDYVKPTETESPSRNGQTIGQFDKQSSMSSTDQNKIHPNANKQFVNLILGDSIIKRISHKLFSKHQETLKISLSGRGRRDVHSFVNEKLQLNVHPKNVFIQVGSNDLSNNIKPNKLMEMTENLSFSIKEKFESSNLIFCGIIPRIDNEAFNYHMKIYNNMLKNFCHESGYKYCDNSNIDGPLYYVNDGIHLNTSKGIPTLVKNMNNCIGNYYQPVHPRKTYRDSVKMSTSFQQSQTSRDNRLPHDSIYNTRFNRHQDVHEISHANTLTEIKDCLKLLVERRL